MEVELKIPIMEELNENIKTLIALLQSEDATPVKAAPQEEKAEEVFDNEFTVLTPNEQGPFDDPVTLDDLSVAGAQLMQTVGMPKLTELINSFGVASLMELPKERYSEFATKLREMGAQL